MTEQTTPTAAHRVVIVDEIPRLPSGKLLRRLLKERLWMSG